MCSQMGNGHGKGTKSGDRKTKEHSTKKSTGLNVDCSKSQGVENGDSQQVEEGHRLFLEDQAKKKGQMKDLKEKVCMKSSDPVSGAEKHFLRNQAGSSSMSSSLDTNEHHKAVTQGSCSMDHVPLWREGQDTGPII